MPDQYEAIKRELIKKGLSKKEAKKRAAKIYNANRDDGDRPVTRNYDKKKGK